MTELLTVLLRERAVAELGADERGRLELRYLSDARVGVDAISVALPVREQPYGNDECRGVLDWILPERQVRANIAQRIHADPSDTFALLTHYGRECAGAIQFTTDDPSYPAPTVSWLDENELARRIDDLSTNPFLSLDEDDIELSLGGVQEKALVVIDGERIGLPRHGAISTHIVKPDISDRLRSVLAEYFALRLAQAVGLSTATVTLRSVGERLVLFVERFDRLVDATGALRREHHETCAQALDVPPEQKYQIRGGPGIGELAEFVRRYSSNAARDLRSLTTLIIYNALIGNADAHIGNFGVMHYANGALRLAPAYDLLPYQAMLGKPPKSYAMKLGDTYEFGNVTRERVQQCAVDLRVAPRGAIQIWEQLRDDIPPAVAALTDEISGTHSLTNDDQQLLERIATDAVSRC